MMYEKKSKKTLLLTVLIIVNVLYTYSIIINSDRMGDILSPIITLIASGIIFWGFVKKQETAIYKWFGWLLTLAVFSWFLCDFWWGIQTLFLKCNPEQNLITIYGYSLSNLFLFLAIVLTAYQDLKKINKVQALLDIVIVSICISVLLWLFVFEQDNDQFLLLLSDPVSMACIMIDIIIYAWINVWSFSTRQIKPLVHHRILVTGGLIFVVADFIYYYMFFYADYLPNSWVDFAYMISFSLLAVSVVFKTKEQPESNLENSEKLTHFKFGFETLILVAPLIVLIFKRSQFQYFILLVVSLLIYYDLINFTQKSIFQGKLLELEKNTVAELERKVEERTEEIIRLLNTDFVSGLYSRRYFESKLLETIKNIHKDELVSLLYIDQNKSKAVKHLYGKDTFEKLQKIVAESLKQIVKSKEGIIASYGDDVFVVMICGIHADIVAKKVADQAIERCNEVFWVDEHAIKVTMNIGISCYPSDTQDENSLIKNADMAMIQARNIGFNKIQTYSDKIGDLAYNRHRIELKLKNVEFDNEFILYYQPQVYCEYGNLCGFETLIRWFEEGKNFLSPLEFIPIAEETGIIIPLGNWIIENAARQYAFWKEKTGKDYRIAVNVSTKQLVEADFVENLNNLLNKYHVNPDFFEVEITESQQIENNINILETLNEIKSLGVSIAIDDFGTGYSSLHYMKSIPADRIKIAKELVDNIESDLYSNSIIQMVISVAKIKGIKVIAEGVETKEQWECLKSLGFDEIQGYYFAKPMPVLEIEKNWIF